MGAFPTSDLPGQKFIHQTVVSALDRCQESQDVEFKESASWDTLKTKVIRTALGMGNLRDGGVIVIGVSERNGTWTKTGIKTKHLKTYDPDIMIDQINSYVAPYVDLDIVLVKHEKKEFLAVYVHEFRELPLVCKRFGPEGDELVKGALYTRTPGKPQTTRIMDPVHMRDVLDLAVEKKVRRLIETFKQIGITDTQVVKRDIESENLFAVERGEL